MEQIGRKSGYGEGTQQDSPTVYPVSMETDPFKKDTRGEGNRLWETCSACKKEPGDGMLDTMR